MAERVTVAYNADGARSHRNGRDGRRIPRDPTVRSVTYEPATMTIAIASERTRQRLQERLGGETRAEVYFDRGMRGLYATDASLYQIEPIGVVVPRTVADDVAASSRSPPRKGCRSCPAGPRRASRGRRSARRS